MAIIQRDVSLNVECGLDKMNLIKYTHTTIAFASVRGVDLSGCS